MSDPILITPDYKRTEPDERLVRGGIFPSAQTWQSLGALGNWLSSQGSCIVAGSACTSAMLLDGTAYIFNYRTKPRAQAIQRIWCIFARIDQKVGTPFSATANLRVRTPSASGTVRDYTIGVSRAAAPIYYVETLAFPSATVQDLTISIKPTGADCWVESIRCYEIPRAALEVSAADDWGQNLLTERAGQRIISSTEGSVRGPVVALEAADPRRVGLFHLSLPTTIPLTRTANTYQDILTLPVPILVPKLGNGNLKETVYWSVYARVAAGAGGTIKITTTHSGVSDTVVVAGTVLAWTTKQAITVDCEDMDSVDGRQTAGAPVWDEMQISFKGDGANLLSIAGFSVWSEAT